MLFVLSTGVPWRDLPGCYGPWNSVYTRYCRWCAGGLFAQMLTILTINAVGELRPLDCYHIMLHQHGSNLRGKAAQEVGRTNGGLNTKLSVGHIERPGSQASEPVE
jgi:transposase